MSWNLLGTFLQFKNRKYYTAQVRGRPGVGAPRKGEKGCGLVKGFGWVLEPEGPRDDAILSFLPQLDH